jgi:tripartite-type tricarboxylate transporter receptor subunit TctC
VDYTITTLSNALPLINSGRLKALAVTGAKRHDLVRHVPTMLESAPPGFVFESWSSLFAPAGVPRDVLTLLNREVVTILNEASTREFIANNGSSPRPRTLAQSAEFLRKEAQTAVELVKAIGATAQ